MENPPMLPTICGTAVETIVVSIAASAMVSTRPRRTGPRRGPAGGGGGHRPPDPPEGGGGRAWVDEVGAALGGAAVLANPPPGRASPARAPPRGGLPEDA